MDRKFWANLGVSILVGSGVMFALANMGQALTEKGLFVKDPQPSEKVAALLSRIELRDYSLSGQAGNLVDARFIVSNSSDRDIKNLEVLCEFYGENGQYLDRKRWLLGGVVPAGKTMEHSSTTRRFVHTRSRRVQCRLVDFDLVEPPAFVLHRETGGHHGGHGATGKMSSHGQGEQHGHSETTTH